MSVSDNDDSDSLSLRSTMPGSPASRLPTIEVRYSLLKAWCGTLACVVVALATSSGLVNAIPHEAFRQADIREYLTAACAALIFIAALYGLPVYLRRLADRSAQLSMSEAGLHYLRNPSFLISWSKIRNVSLSGVRTNGTVTWAKVTLTLSVRRVEVMDVEGLDQTPEFIAEAVRARIRHEVRF